MNLNCPSCDSRVDDVGRCSRCDHSDETARYGPDPYLVALGDLDLHAEEEKRVYASAAALRRRWRDGTAA